LEVDPFVADEDLDMDVASKPTLESLLGMLEKDVGLLPHMFGKASYEEKYVKTHQLMARELDSFIRDRALIPASVLQIAPESSITVVLIMVAMDYNNSAIQVIFD
jgi:hypothetical protein